MAAKSTLELILELKNRVSGGLNKVKQSVSKDVQEMKEKVSGFRTSVGESFDDLKAEVPFLGRFSELMSNPWVLGAAAVTGMVTAVTGLSSHLFQVSEEIQVNQRNIQALIGVTGQELADTTASVISLSKVLGVENKELIKSANALQSEYEDTGLSIAGSLDLIRQGLQATNGQLDLEEVKEYASQMKAAGLNAEQFIALSVIGRKEGILNDKSVDAVKEFNLRIKEMTPAAKTALQGIGLSADTLLDGLNSGSMTTLDILRQVSESMGRVDAQARQTAIADLFGGAGEDAGERFLLSLAKADFAMDSLIDKNDSFIKMQNERIRLEGLIASKQQEFAPQLNEIRQRFELLMLSAKVLFYDTIAAGIQFVNEHGDTMIGILKGILAGLLIIKAPVIATFAAWAAQAGLAALSTFSIQGALIAVRTALFSIPIVGWIAAAVAGLVTLYNTWDEFRQAVHGTLNVFKEFFPVIQALGKLIAAAFTFNPLAIKNALGELKDSFANFSLVDSFNRGFDAAAPGDDSSDSPSVGLGGLSTNSQTTPGGATPGGRGTPVSGGVGQMEQVKSLNVHIDAVHKGDVKVVKVDGIGSMTPAEFAEWHNRLLMGSIRNIELTG